MADLDDLFADLDSVPQAGNEETTLSPTGISCGPGIRLERNQKEDDGDLRNK